MKALPSHQRLMVALGWAGREGMTHSEIASLVDLSPKTLQALLNALARSGEVSVFQRTDGTRVYRRLL